MLLKWSAGFNALSTMGDAVMKFLSFAEEGAEFIYGENYQEHYFAFVVLSIIVFFGSFLGVCYHLGIVQVNAHHHAHKPAQLLHSMSYWLQVRGDCTIPGKHVPRGPAVVLYAILSL